jgi:hypothetical protein
MGVNLFADESVFGHLVGAEPCWWQRRPAGAGFSRCWNDGSLRIGILFLCVSAWAWSGANQIARAGLSYGVEHLCRSTVLGCSFAEI